MLHCTIDPSQRRRVRGLIVAGLFSLSSPGIVGCATPSETVVAEPATPAAAAPTPPADPAPPAEPAKPAAEPAGVTAVAVGACNERQAEISKQADERSKSWTIAQHLAKNFPDMKVSWLMKETPYQNFVVKTNAEKFGRCDDTGCYLFAAPTAVIQQAVDKAVKGKTHDAAVLGAALGLPAKNFEGPLRMMTLDLRATNSCVRLPVDADPGVWKCQSEADKDCFKFGGYTSGNVPEVMVIDAPVAQAVVREIP